MQDYAEAFKRVGTDEDHANVHREASLFVLASRIQELEAKLRANDEELTDDLEAEFDAVHGAFDDKAQAIMDRLWEAQAELAKAETAFAIVKERRDTVRRVCNRFSKLLGTQMKRANRESVDVELEGVEYQAAVKVRTETIVPDAYYEDPEALKKAGVPVSSSVVHTFSRTDVRKLIKAGKAPDGCRIKETYSVEVR